MNPKDITSETLYEVEFHYPDSSISPVQGIVFIYKKIISIFKNLKGYEMDFECLATNKKPQINLNVMNVNFKKPLTADDLPLYIHFQNKATNFDNLLKGSPLGPAEYVRKIICYP